jgi:hypothetical protein
MTALCGGGTSGPKAGVAETVIFTSTQIGSLLNNKGGLWATLAVPALGVLAYEATELCSSDPPPQPTLTANDYQALLQLSPQDEFLAALGKLKDLVTIALWYELCECKTVTTPQPSTGLLNPPAGVTLPDFSTTPCAQPRMRLNVDNYNAAFDDSNNITTSVFPNLQTTQSVPTDSSHPSQTIAVIPSTWSSWHATNQLVTGQTPPTSGYAVAVNTYGRDRRPLATPLTTPVTNTQPFVRQPDTGDVQLSAAEAYVSVNTIGQPSPAVPGVVDWSLFINCSGPAGTLPGCCQDPVLAALVTALGQELQLLRKDTQLLQRYSVPFAYVLGPSHVGLTGSGSLQIGRAVGLKIDVTAFPGDNQQMLGTPPYIFDLGWISVLTPDGLLDEVRLTRTSTTWMSKLIPSATVAGWGLREGVTASITEMRAEP